jgi:hypothetical protein
MIGVNAGLCVHAALLAQAVEADSVGQAVLGTTTAALDSPGAARCAGTGREYLGWHREKIFAPELGLVTRIRSAPDARRSKMISAMAAAVIPAS